MSFELGFPARASGFSCSSWATNVFDKWIEPRSAHFLEMLLTFDEVTLPFYYQVSYLPYQILQAFSLAVEFRWLCCSTNLITLHLDF